MFFRQLRAEFSIWRWSPLVFQFGEYWCVWLRLYWFRAGILSRVPGDDIPMFSERYGHSKVWRFRWFRIKYIPSR